ncbi:hypothetical protein [Brevibacillus sp. DP1.3A]|uniref:hypothetical protein n=1 Tax=Brevibacillus sp. DP1.3A TaxID=2738867 RepID=UPI00156AF5B0|nr:hypothetical protein [Brevibacillus sp. DP1.3A]UED72499.1 hypothetical protein HP399_017240 [Brevibacillus sp. DP1.3A]
MALPKKGTRGITVGEQRYRWVISPAAKGLLALTIQHNEGLGQLIRVYVKSDVNDFWAEFPLVQHLDMRVIKPAEVAAIIEEAIKLGWQPDKKGAPLSFDFIGSTLVKKGDT